MKIKVKTDISNVMKYFALLVLGNLICMYVSKEIGVASHISWTFSVIGNCNFSSLLFSLKKKNGGLLLLYSFEERVAKGKFFVDFHFNGYVAY